MRDYGLTAVKDEGRQDSQVSLKNAPPPLKEQKKSEPGPALPSYFESFERMLEIAMEMAMNTEVKDAVTVSVDRLSDPTQAFPSLEDFHASSTSESTLKRRYLA